MFDSESGKAKVDIKKEIFEIIANFNKIKRGLADVELDYDLIIKTIEKIDANQLSQMSHFGIRSVSYSILFLI